MHLLAVSDPENAMVPWSVKSTEVEVPVLHAGLPRTG